MSKPETLMVRCSKGLRFPLPRQYMVNATKNYISDDETTEVKNCSLVRKRIKAGDLLLVKNKISTKKGS